MPETDVLPTPEGYASPEQLKAARELYKDYLTGHGQMQNIQSPWQGISNMVHALVGGYGLYRAGQQERQTKTGDAAARIPETTPDASESGAPIEAPKPVPWVPKTAPAPSGTSLGYDEDKANNAISGIESGGNYSLLGPVTKDGDRAYGKHQVMGKNIGQWTKEALGRSMTPDEFLRNASAQDAVFKHKFGEYTAKYGPEGAARAWFAGEGGMNNPNRKDQLGTSVNSYSQRFQKAYGSEPPLAFNGEPTNVPQAGAPAPMSNALAAGAVAPGGIPPARSVPSIGGDIPAGVIPQRPRYTREQLQRVLSSDYTSPADKAAALEMYTQQNNPMELQTTGGKYLIGRDKIPYFVGDTHWIKEHAGEAGTETPMVMDPRTGMWGARTPSMPSTGAKPPVQNNVPNLNYVDPNAPVGKGMLRDIPPELGGLPPEIMKGQSKGVLPEMPDFEAERPPAPVVVPPDTTHGIDRGSKGDKFKPSVPLQDGQTPGGMLNFAPPDSGDVLAQAVPAPRAGTEGKVAEAGGTRLQQLQDMSLDYAGKKHSQEKDIDAYQKKSDLLIDVGQRAKSSREMIAFARKLIDDPQFYSGTARGLVLDVKKIEAFLKNNNAALPMEAFQKIISGQLLEDMKISLQGLGQVRVAEIELLQKAAAAGDLTPQANRMILDLMIKAHDRVGAVGDIAAGYQAGARWDSNGKVIRGPDGQPQVFNTPPKQGELNGLVNRYYEKNPILTPEEQAHLTKLAASPTGYGNVGQPKFPKYAPERPQPPKEKKATNPPAPPASSPAEAPPKGYQ